MMNSSEWKTTNHARLMVKKSNIGLGYSTKLLTIPHLYLGSVNLYNRGNFKPRLCLGVGFPLKSIQTSFTIRLPKVMSKCPW